MTSARDIPTVAKDYSYDPARTAIVVMNAIEFFRDPTDGFPPRIGALKGDREYFGKRLACILPALTALVEGGRAAGAEVVWVRPAFQSPNAADWPPAYRETIIACGLVDAAPGTQLAEFLAEFEPLEHELVVGNRAISALWGSNLDALLRNRGVEHVAVAGLLGNLGVINTALDAAHRGYTVSAVEDATASSSEAAERAAFQITAYAYETIASADLLAKLRTSAVDGGR